MEADRDIEKKLKRIIVLKAETIKGSPAYLRHTTITSQLEKIGYYVIELNVSQVNLKGFLKTNLKEFMNRTPVFISAPPFKLIFFGLIALLPVYIDIRDGWSVAIQNGYGSENIKRRPIKAFIARLVELLLIMKARNIFCATDGISKYLTTNLPRIDAKILVISNGHSYELNKAFFSERCRNNAIKILILGKFEEYGIKHALQSLKVVSERYQNNDIVVHKYSYKLDPEIVSAAAQLNIKIELKRPLNNKALVKASNDYDFGLAIVRDANYEVGTKVYDYLAFGLPIIKLYDDNTEINYRFKNCFDTDYDAINAYEKAVYYQRANRIENVFAKIFN